METKSKTMDGRKRKSTCSSTQPPPKRQLGRACKVKSSETHHLPAPPRAISAPVDWVDYDFELRTPSPPILRPEISSTGNVKKLPETRNSTRNSVRIQSRTRLSQRYDEQIGNVENMSFNNNNNAHDVTIELEKEPSDLSQPSARNREQSTVGARDTVLAHSSVFHKVTKPSRRYAIVEPNPIYSTEPAPSSVRPLNVQEQQTFENPEVILESLEQTLNDYTDQIEGLQAIPPHDQYHSSHPECNVHIIRDNSVSTQPMNSANIVNFQTSTNSSDNRSLNSSDSDNDVPMEIIASYSTIFCGIQAIGLKLYRRPEIPGSGMVYLRQLLNVVSDAHRKFVLPEDLDVVMSTSSNFVHRNNNILPQNSGENEELGTGTSTDCRANNNSVYNGIGNRDEGFNNLGNSTMDNGVAENNC